ncbi:hypothetical protein F5X98DRAFT_244308 [Xylaria grammica]|nr:hypothetical protein F5X98DRAFT_244308 [Xylaria grammica]
MQDEPNGSGSRDAEPQSDSNASSDLISPSDKEPEPGDKGSVDSFEAQGEAMSISTSAPNLHTSRKIEEVESQARLPFPSNLKGAWPKKPVSKPKAWEEKGKRILSEEYVYETDTSEEEVPVSQNTQNRTTAPKLADETQVSSDAPREPTDPVVRALAILEEETGWTGPALISLEDSVRLFEIVDVAKGRHIPRRLREELGRGVRLKPEMTIGELKRELNALNRLHSSPKDLRKQLDAPPGYWLGLRDSSEHTKSPNDVPGPANSFPREPEAPGAIEKLRQTAISSLSFPQAAASQITVDKESSEAFYWFLDKRPCRSWLDTSKHASHNGMLWIKGNPGLGKSSLMKFMVSYTRQSFKKATIISFFFDFRGNELQKSEAGLYRSLLVQLLQARPDLQRVLDTATVGPRWDIGTLKSLLNTAISLFGRGSLIFFVDALDECEVSRIPDILTHLTMTCDRAASSETELRICLASRRIYPHLKIPRGLEYILEARSNAMAEYLNDNLTIGNDEVAETIRFEVEKRASGNFKWATLVTNWLNEEYAESRDLHRLYFMVCKFPVDHDRLSQVIGQHSGKQLQPPVFPQEGPAKFTGKVGGGKETLGTACEGCRRRKIKCDEKRPACSACVRLKLHCFVSPISPVLRATTHVQETVILKPNRNLADTNTTHQNAHRSTEIEPSPSDSGYATVSYGSRSRLSQSRPKSDSEDDDVQTVYTEVAGHSDMRTESYVDTFADDLFTKIGGKQLSVQMIERLSSSLPPLLKALALNIGYQNQTQAQRDMMVFIHKQRLAITSSFRCHYDHTKDLNSQTSITREPKPTEVMDRWLASTDESRFEKFETEPPEDDPGFAIHGERPEELGLTIPELDEYRKTLAEDPSYAWMLARLRRDLILSKGQYDIINRLRDAIQSAFPQSNHVSRKKSPEEVRVTFTANWDIMGFLHQQDYSISHSEAIANAVTLTGTETHAQALTCRQYMAQMWPFTGSQTLKLIQETLKSAERKTKLFFSTPCRLTLEASIVDGLAVVVTASGLPYFIAEVGEQLAWLGSALRPSPPGPDTSVYICTPSHAIRGTMSRGPPRTVHFLIEYNMERAKSSGKIPNGQCWTYLFSRPVIAGGFPIMLRQELGTGLEMPLELMVALTGTKYINTFDSKMFIKGFNTMLVPAKHAEGLIVWHLLCSRNPAKRISYLSSTVESADVTKADLEKSRHVLGWCADATSIVGTTRATYNIERSRLRKVHSHHMLEKVEVSAGQFVTGTAAFTLGNREKPVHITRYGFLAKLQCISSKHMVLWDEGDKRGWLVNGASALLHILRASLEHSKQKFGSAWLLDPCALKDPNDLSRPDAALQVLINENNRNLTLYMDKTEVFEENVREGATTTSTSRRQTRHYRLEDRIEHIYNTLEKLIDHQADVERRSGLQLKIRPRQHLEGWDFKDLVKDGDPIYPRVTTLPTIGKGWVDFTRAIHAVTLFGRGFGELIQPRATGGERVCSRWSTVPKDNYYLAACVAHLQEIMEEDGDAASNPRRLCDNVIWHMKRATFDSCPCTKAAGASAERSHHHDPVQALFPLKFTGSLQKKPQVDLEGAGAVIFGHNMSLHWHWKDTGDPVKGDPPADTWDAAAADLFEDSGIGSSLASSRFLSDPGSAGSQSQSQGEKSPAQSQLTVPSSPPSRPAQRRGPKRSFQGIVEAASKKLRR